MSDIYHLYLDESETHETDPSGKWYNQVFCIAGIIVKEDYHQNYIIPEVNKIKQNIWPEIANNSSIILHEKEIRFALNPHNKFLLKKVSSEYRRFNNQNNARKLFNGLGKIVRQPDVTIIGGCIVVDELHRAYNANILSNKSLIAMQVILENYCHFLNNHHGIGKIFYEAIGDDQSKEMCLRFHHIKAMGTMYVSPYAIQQSIISIDFPKKPENIAGLQIADFIPNDIAREVLNKKQHQFNINKEINMSKYDGMIGNKSRYGVKIMVN